MWAGISASRGGRTRNPVEPTMRWRNASPRVRFEAPSPFMPVTVPPPDLVESLRDRYELQRELGHGGMATVYLARDLRHERPVALKVLHPELGAVLGAERFLREIETAAGLQHPHILPLFDSGEAAGRLWYYVCRTSRARACARGSRARARCRSRTLSACCATCRGARLRAPARRRAPRRQARERPADADAGTRSSPTSASPRRSWPRARRRARRAPARPPRWT